MPSFDAVVVGESWISEHYLTSDGRSGTFLAEVLGLRDTWDETEKAGHPSARSALRDAATTLARRFGGLGEKPSVDEIHGLHREVRRALLLDRDVIEWVSDRSGDEVRLPAAVVHPTPTGTALLVVEARPVAAVEELLDPNSGVLLDAAEVGGRPLHGLAKTISTVFLADDAPPLLLVQAGRWLLLSERARWPEGRWLAVDLGVVVDRRDVKRAGELEHVAAMFGPDLLLPGDDGQTPWLDLLEKSVAHTVGVSADLRRGVRLSISIIANDVVTRRAAHDLPVLGIPDLGQQLARQSLRFLYRILFLLYAEASPQLEVLPVQAPEYQAGYGLDRLRDLILTDLSGDQARTGTHLYDSLALLFRLVDQGYDPRPATPRAGASGGLDVASLETDTESGDAVTAASEVVPGEQLVFQALRSDLFAPAATALIDEVGLGNESLQQVLRHLLLTPEKKDADRGFISYGELGINQLGAVYEGLMSWSGMIAETDMFEVAKDGDPSGGSWLLPAERIHEVPGNTIVTEKDPDTGEPRPVLHRRGSFVFRLAGRERQQSASYYTPESLTRSVVRHALAELLDQNGTTTKAEDILRLTICEPALGSGAFAIEAVRQLAAEYLKRAQDERGERIPAEQYPAELQKVKAYLALHQVYGVDLNPTAVELAEVSLWLDTMQAGLAAPWFGLHLRAGNSLIGARRAVYEPVLLKGRKWLTTIPRDVALHEPASPGVVPSIGSGIHHFLLPAAGWGAVVDTPEARTHAPERREALRAWRSGVLASPDAAIAKRLGRLATRVEALWTLARRRIELAEMGIRRDTGVWGADPKVTGLPEGAEPVTREQVEKVLSDPGSAYRRLRRVMDAWCALWAWPLTTDVHPPTWDAWLGGLEAILGLAPADRKAARQEQAGQTTFTSDLTWRELDDAEELDLGFADARPVDEVLERYSWLQVAEQIAGNQRSFHWELEFPQVFVRGGFDLQVGNPPWVRPDWDDAEVLAEHDPWWSLAPKAAEKEKLERRKLTFALPGAEQWYLEQRAEQAGTVAHLASQVDRPLLHGLQPDLYRCFMERTWRSGSSSGIVSLIHPETHFSEVRAATLRREAYRRLRRHWNFRNQHHLFADISNTRSYGIHVYGAIQEPNFLNAAWLFESDVIDRSLIHDGSGPQPGVKDDESRWDIRPHRARITLVNREVLSQWSTLVDENGSSADEARMIFPVNQASAEVLAKLANAPRFGAFAFEWTRGWEEDRDRRLGFFERRPAKPTSWKDVIFQGPNFTVATPLFQQTRSTAKSGRDYDLLDPEVLDENFRPQTVYQRAKPADEYQSSYPKWNDRPSSEYFRLAWREMADAGTVRTLQSAVLMPGPTHVHAVNSITTSRLDDLVIAAGIQASIIADFFIKIVSSAHIQLSMINKLPHVRGHALEHNLVLRALRLNCLVRPYAPLWSELYSPLWHDDRWVPGVGVDYQGRPEIGNVTADWEWATPLRRAADRRQALVEIDAIVAVMLGLTADELVTVYRTQFPVLRQYERAARYDSQGRELPSDLVKELAKHEGSARPVHALEGPGRTYVGPFTGVDRERDLRIAHDHFSRLAAERQRAATASPVGGARA